MINYPYVQIIASARPAFLVLAPCCLLLSLAFAIAEGRSLDLLNLALIFIGAVTAHISVNMFNEYEDFNSGLDLHTHRTPFSGGSGLLPSQPELAGYVHNAAIMSLSITVLIGCYFLVQGYWGLLTIGLFGVVLIYFYTKQITHKPWLCLIAPGLAFGPLMIIGTYYIISGQFSWAVLSSSMVVFFLVSNLLLLNQFPDLEADAEVGRMHLPILLGRNKSALIYIAFLALAYLEIIINVLLGFLPIYSLLGLLTLYFAVPAARIALSSFDDIPNLIPAMGLNVKLTLATPVLVAIGKMLPT